MTTMTPTRTLTPLDLAVNDRAHFVDWDQPEATFCGLEAARQASATPASEPSPAGISICMFCAENANARAIAEDEADLGHFRADDLEATL